eukprot:scaffold4510_cov183-Amphora_coffeaeformis.AAC.26
MAASSTSSAVVAFAPPLTTRMQQQSSTTALQLGIPKFLLPKDEQESDSKERSPAASNEKKLGMKGLLQLITAGAGAPFLGDFEGVDEETGKFMFSLEANNLVDENGNSKQTSMPYLESGWVDEEDAGFSWPWDKKKKDS